MTLGTYLQGTITFCKDEIGKKVDVHTFKYVLTEPSKKNNNNKNDKEKMTKFDEYTEALRDLKCNWLAKLGNIFFSTQKVKICSKNYNNKLQSYFNVFFLVSLNSSFYT